jgi:alpha-galactosidase
VQRVRKLSINFGGQYRTGYQLLPEENNETRPKVFVHCTGRGADHLSARVGRPNFSSNSTHGLEQLGFLRGDCNGRAVKANADWLSKYLKSAGWQYVVVDMEWFVTNPVPEGNAKDSIYSLDDYGRYVPPANRFPSAKNNTGFKPIADYVHSLGLKFGIHILQGIPKEAVTKNLPINGSPFHALDAANTSGTCKWNFDNYDVNNNPAGQAYYDSIAQLYASWGVDLIKVDCIAFGPYKGDEIRMLNAALRKTHRPIALSLSPGPAPLDKLEEMRKYAQMWRVSNDIWDIWHSGEIYPQGLGDQFANLAKWSGRALPGHWPDADMLPLGYLGPAPGWGIPRDTRLTHDEQKTFLTLWSIFRSPLMMGGDLPHTDDWTKSLLTNAELIEVDQQSTGSRLVLSTDTAVVWSSKSTSGKGDYLAVFNISGTSQDLGYTWKQLGLQGVKYKVRDLWEHTDLGTKDSLALTIPSHGCALFSLATTSRK